MIHGVGFGQHDVQGIVSFEPVGGAEQVDLAVFECLDRRPSGLEAPDLDGQTGGRAQEPGIVGGVTFILVTADGQIEGRIIRG
ncbi:hypothetical protein D3C87_1647260 [compost metagenome]